MNQQLDNGALLALMQQMQQQLADQQSQLLSLASRQSQQPDQTRFRLPDPPRFDGKPFSLRTWLPSIQAKLTADGLTGQQAFDYVYNRLETPQQASVLHLKETNDPNQIFQYFQRICHNPRESRRVSSNSPTFAKKTMKRYAFELSYEEYLEILQRYDRRQPRPFQRQSSPQQRQRQLAPEPMDLSVNRTKIGREARQRQRQQEGLCRYCGSPDHYINQCNDPTWNPQYRYRRSSLTSSSTSSLSDAESPPKRRIKATPARINTPTDNHVDLDYPLVVHSDGRITRRGGG
ncbi:uncharacterized protein ATNIH1004_011706 [Aspergillus tanneri]|uniref:Retrotransposon gag domain-containing protein n=1 Tax=Aspergillus tanneri TaxID=1220188 RepID=A0A5M9M7U4_9EURO|nr:uncharacterized protein ATNIH1004_011706 [Aspergillus tanneri]KAA8641570.1 hypothetical protein ATNIH1004_011706 [Aspergillus tanneri]